MKRGYFKAFAEAEKYADIIVLTGGLDFTKPNS